MKNKLFLVLIFVAISLALVILSLVLINYRKTTSIISTSTPTSVIIKNQVIEGDDAVKKCIENNLKQLTSENFVRSQIIIGFKDNITIDEAKSLLQSYKLISASSNINNWLWPNIPRFLLVPVPENSELKWKCILENDQNINSVDLNWISYAQ